MRIKNRYLVLLCIGFLLLAVFLFAGCDKNVNDKNDTNISSTFFEQIDNKTWFASVSNDTETFSFLDTIEIADDATYLVSTDITCNNIVKSKTVALSIGDNKFYIMVENGEEMALHTITIRRRPLYCVTFDTKGGDAVPEQIVEENGFAEKAVTQRVGYDFDGWDFNFSSEIVRDTVIVAKWKPIKYTITYDLNDESLINKAVNNSSNPREYTIEDDIVFCAPSAKGYTFKGWDIKEIKHTIGDIVVIAHWEPTIYSINIDVGYSRTLSPICNWNELIYGYTINDTANERLYFPSPIRKYYDFLGWDIPYIEVGDIGDKKIVASWKAHTKNINYIIGDAENAVTNPLEYTIDDGIITFDDAKGEELFCGWYADAKYTTQIKQIDSSTFEDITIYALFDGTIGLQFKEEYVTSYNGESTVVKIPHTYFGQSITKIKSLSNATITDIIIPDSIVYIDNGALNGCSNLVNLTIPFVGASRDAKVSLCLFGYIFGADAYDGCVEVTQSDGFSDRKCCLPSTLKTVVVTNSNIPDYAFYYCSGLTIRLTSDTPISIGEQAFSATTTTLIIDGKLSSIGVQAFWWSTVNIKFNGTKADWRNVSKESKWDKAAVLTIECIDGIYEDN